MTSPHDQSPAATIRHAITLLRGTAAKATPGRRSVVEIRDPGPFGFPARVLATRVNERGNEVTSAVADARHEDAAFTALMSREVAEALADWLEAELAAHEQAGVLAAAATSGELHIGGGPARVEVGLSTLDKAHAVALAVTWHNRNRTGTATPTCTDTTGEPA